MISLLLLFSTNLAYIYSSYPIWIWSWRALIYISYLLRDSSYNYLRISLFAFDIYVLLSLYFFNYVESSLFLLTNFSI